MFSKVSEEWIKQAIQAETEEAKIQYGKTYYSLHEGYAVLKEEVEEARDERTHIQNNFYQLWEAVKINDTKSINKLVEKIRDHAEKLALEAVQVAAVCNKINNTIS